MKKLESLGRILSKDEQKKISGGNSSSTVCKNDDYVCHEGEGKVYYCSSHRDQEEGEITECCCGHSDYNYRCLGS
jgi:hypothetical protein